MLAAILAAGLIAGTPVPPTSAEGKALVEAVRASLETVRAQQAQLPPPRDDAERIVRLGALDQAPRKIVTTFDFSRIPDADRETAIRAQAVLMEASDHAILAQLLKLVPPEGWFAKSRYGEDASRAAFLIVQHADDDTLRRFLPRLEASAKSGEIDGRSYAGMFDRVATDENRPQRYGTQFRCDGGKWRPYPLEDEGKVDALRKEIGADALTFAREKAMFQNMPPCPQTSSPPPPGMKFD